MSRFPFNAVIFDLDGTLVATERYWPDAARSATRAFFEEQGITRSIPASSEWLSMVGRPLEEAFAESFPDLDPGARTALLGACQASEAARLGRGHAALLGGVAEALDQLQARGVRLGVASNCGLDYLEAMLNGLGLSRWIEQARCLRSPGVSDKAGMIAELLDQFETRSAVVVGDRRGDRDATWENGLPFVHVPRGYGMGEMDIGAEAVLDGMDQLIERLEQRDVVLRGILDDLPSVEAVAVTGLPLAGKSILSEDLRRVARASGRALAVFDDPEPDSRQACDAVIGLIASEDVLVRRARGQRRGVEPVVELLENLPERRASLDAQPSALLLDVDNLLAPKRSTHE